jgi:hypothetical protein
VRTVRLLQTAACAEGLRLRHAVRRVLIRMILLVVAVGFLLLGVCFAHLVAWLTLQPRYGGASVAVGLMLGDLVIACGLALFAVSLRPGRIETEAHAVSAQAWYGVRQSLDLWAVIIALARGFAARRTDDTR